MKRNSTLYLALFAAVLAATGAHAQIAINASAAAAGGVTPGDAPGYPVTLSQAGAYKLTGNLSLTSADPDSVIVHITAANVDLDLNGFTIGSYNVCANTSSHYNGPGNDCLNRKIYDPLVLVEAPFARIHGGYVEGSLGDGIFIASLPSQPGGSVLDDLQITNNRGYGISSVDDGAAVRDSLVTLNGSGSTDLANSRASANAGNGVEFSNLAYETVLFNNGARSYIASLSGCYARLYQRTTSVLTPQVQGGTPLNGSVTACP